MAENSKIELEIFPRPCKNCGNPVEMYKGKLVHSYRKRERCRIFREWNLVRDEKGQVKAMIGCRDIPIPDPLTSEQMRCATAQSDLDKLVEWNKIYSKPEAHAH